MSHVLRPHAFVIFACLVIGVLFGAVAMDTHPPFVGWVFGAGIGLMGGAFLAAITSGEQIVSGPKPRASDFDLGYEDSEDEIPRLLDGLPPRRDATNDE